MQKGGVQAEKEKDLGQPNTTHLKYIYGPISPRSWTYNTYLLRNLKNYTTQNF